MTVTCKNCKNHFHGNYCNTCGQAADTHRISVHFLWHDIQHGLLHLDKGILFTTKELFTRPGNSIREFIQGKRVKHFRPISLILVLAGLYGFLIHYFHINMLANNVQVTGSNADPVAIKNTISKANDWVAQHYALVSLAELPLLSVSTFLIFMRSGYNFMEHVILNAFLTGQGLLLRLFLFPLYYLLNDTPGLKITERFVMIMSTILIIWSLMQFFDKKKKLRTLWMSLLSQLIFMLLVIIVVAVIAYLVFNN